MRHRSGWFKEIADSNGTDSLMLGYNQGDTIYYIPYGSEGFNSYKKEHLEETILNSGHGFPKSPHTRRSLPMSLLIDLSIWDNLTERFFTIVVQTLLVLADGGCALTPALKDQIELLLPMASEHLQLHHRRMFTRSVSQALKSRDKIRDFVCYVSSIDP